MHLLLIHQNFPGQFRNLAPAWLAEGLRISAISAAAQPPCGEAWRRLELWRYSISDVCEAEPTSPAALLQRGQAVAEICRHIWAREQPPDLVMAHSGWGEALQLRRTLPHTPILIYPELWIREQSLGIGFDAQFIPESLPWQEQNRLNLVSELALHQADAAVLPNAAQKASFPKELQTRMQVIAEGVDTTRLQPDRQARLTISGLGTIRAGDPLVTLVSRSLEPLRGLRQALRAWAHVAPHHPSARLLLVGEEFGGYGIEAPRSDSHLQDGLAQLTGDGDRDRIHPLGRLPYPELIRLLQCSACHLSLSYPYTLSWSQLEAMACGAPTITNPGNPLAAELQDGVNGLFVPFNDHRALARAILSLLNDPTLGLSIGDAGRRHVERHLSLEQSLQRYGQLFRQLRSNDRGR